MEVSKVLEPSLPQILFGGVLSGFVKMKLQFFSGFNSYLRLANKFTLNLGLDAEAIGWKVNMTKPVGF